MNFKKIERYLRVNLLGPGPRFVKKRIYRAAVSQRLRNTGVRDVHTTLLSGCELAEHLRREGRDVPIVLVEIMFTGVL